MVMFLLVSCKSAAEVKATPVTRPLRVCAFARLRFCAPIGGVRDGRGLLAPGGCIALPSAAHPPVHGVRVNRARNHDRFALLRRAEAPRVSLGDQLQQRPLSSVVFDCAKIAVLALREVSPS
jgi:hypothetical protein